uniref:Regulator of microtubule dynamics protein 1 n=1 Tax=Globodera pallida TaxID=36090 RepID=A0A183CHB5_GLOPA
MLIGRVVHRVNDDLYIDFGLKFNAVCKRPEKDAEKYVIGSQVLIKLIDPELSERFMGSKSDLTLLEADAKLIGLHYNKNERSGGASQKNRFGILAGGGAALSLSLFGLGKDDKDKQKEANDEQPLLLIREADLYYEASLIDNAYNVLRRHRSSNNPEVLWRLARVLYKQGRAARSAAESKRLCYEAFDFAKKALENQPTTGSFGAHKWYAILLDRTAELEGNKARISKALEVKSHFERALELNAFDATTWHLLGVWHYEFADLPSHMRWLASMVYATPPKSTYDEALRCFERAETISPSFYAANNYYLGLVYEKMNQRNEALEQFKKAYYLPMADLDDRMPWRIFSETINMTRND